MITLPEFDHLSDRSVINVTTKQKTKVERKRITKYKKQKRNNRFYGYGVTEYHPSAGNYCIKHFTPNNTSLYFFLSYHSFFYN